MNKLACILLVGIASLGVGSAQSKVAVVNSQKAILETAEIKKAQVDLEAKFKPRQDQMAVQGQRKQRELQRLQDDLQADVDRERNDILQRSGTHMQEIVKKLADEKGLDVVIDTSNTVFYKASLDLTAEAVAAYDKAYPVK